MSMKLNSSSVKLSPKVANLINGVRGMDRDYRLISEEQLKIENESGLKVKQFLRMTIVVDDKGEYVKHYWG